ncbi:3-isopropylmalate dehydratase large subunit [Petroclostridium sp. X23]|uniref:3-isopropylmalate dehydratase large subunit n=1 Tax=Petroclostridium sp. X23 TaxID=3045146 RepID=UPI0024AD64C8|nr:3-isopropylmalate dehydratase large subunit [Petroclostridium sp. X23]WHH60631.1 3-isopropylmalate dehydratase large subunit [Petroclostridium sp. X23]
MHSLEKIMANAAGVNEVKAGDRVWCKVDLALGIDLYRNIIDSFEEIGLEKIQHPERAGFIFGINAPAPTIRSAQNEKDMREFCKKHGAHIFDINSGVVYQHVMEKGYIFPGAVSVANDSHATVCGALGAFGTGTGGYDTAAAMGFGEMWFRVPEVIRIELKGKLQKGVFAKDIVLKILKELKSDFAIYKAIEYAGEAVTEMCLAERMVLCNMAVEMGAKTSYIQPDEKVFEFLKGRVNHSYTVFETDSDYQYCANYVFDVSKLVPQVALPHNVDNVSDIIDIEPFAFDQGLIGTCTGGRLEDLEAAAKILKGKRVHPDVRMLIVPATYEIYSKAIEKGYIQTFIDAGCVICNAGCGPCLGAHMGVLAEGEKCITASNRNFSGRMGHKDSELYLASPATVAASCVEGVLTDPRKYL